jgi:hypothetical protein
MTTDLMFELWHSFFASMLIWHTSSRVGARTMPLGRHPLSSIPCSCWKEEDLRTGMVSAELSPSGRGDDPSSDSKLGGKESASPLSSPRLSSAVVLDCDWESEPLSRLPSRLMPLGSRSCSCSAGGHLAADSALTTGSKKEKVLPEP